jgi:fatty acid desaturase
LGIATADRYDYIAKGTPRQASDEMTTTRTGMGTAEWPLSGSERIPKSSLKALRQRKNVPGLLHLAAHLLALLLTGSLVHLSLGTWAIVPAWLVHGTVIVLLFAPLHECSHFTAFRSRWLNYAVGVFAAVVTLRPFFYFKWRHAAHHTYTQHAAKDPDIIPFPASWKDYLLTIVGARYWTKTLGTYWRGITGKLSAFELGFVPASDVRRVCWEIRLTALLYVLVAAASVAAGSWIALTYWLIPRFLGEPVLRAIRMAEHTGADESPNLLANTRTTRANPMFRALYWNMPFHAEHHLASSVPFHALKRLHAEVRQDLACVGSSYWDVHRQILQQMRAKRRADMRP